jgi:hypothetical protein
LPRVRAEGILRYEHFEQRQPGIIRAFFAPIHAARDDVAAKKLDARSALDALLATVSDRFSGTGQGVVGC